MKGENKMKFDEPKIEFVQFDNDVVTATSSTQCLDGYTGGTLDCTGANMEGYCGAKMAATNG